MAAWVHHRLLVALRHGRTLNGPVEQGPSAAGTTLMAWPPYYDFILFAGDDLRHIPDRLAEVGDVAVLVQLDRIAEHVRSEIDRVDEGEA